MLFAEINRSGVLDTTQVAFDPVAHRWWQIREQSGILLFEVSPTGAIWTTIAQKPTPPFLSDARIELFAGVYQIEVEPVGKARFDNLHDCYAP